MTPHLVFPSWSTCRQVEFGLSLRTRGFFNEHIGLLQGLADASERAVEPSRVALNSNEPAAGFNRRSTRCAQGQMVGVPGRWPDVDGLSPVKARIALMLALMRSNQDSGRSSAAGV